MMRLPALTRGARGLPLILSFSRKGRRNPRITASRVERAASPLPIRIRLRMRKHRVASSPRRACRERGRGEGVAGRNIGMMKLSSIFVAVFISALALSGCGEQKSAETPPVRPVLYAEVNPQTSVILGPFAGSVEPRYKTQLGFRTFGRLIARGAEVGEVVKQGTRLAALDPALQAAAAAQRARPSWQAPRLSSPTRTGAEGPAARFARPGGYAHGDGRTGSEEPRGRGRPRGASPGHADEGQGAAFLYRDRCRYRRRDHRLGCGDRAGGCAGQNRCHHRPAGCERSGLRSSRATHRHALARVRRSRSPCSSIRRSRRKAGCASWRPRPIRRPGTGA